MRETHLENDKWWVSPYNFESTVRDGLDLPEKVEIHDATLRDGEQTPGVVFSVDDKIIFLNSCTLVSSKNMCSVRHKPIPSAPKLSAFSQSSGVSALALIFSFRTRSAQDNNSVSGPELVMGF